MTIVNRRFLSLMAVAALLWGGAASGDITPAPIDGGSLKLIGQRRFATPPNSTLTQSQTKCSVSAFVRLDSPPGAPAGYAFVLQRDYWSGPTIYLSSQAGGGSQIYFSWLPADGGAKISHVRTVAAGSSHHVAMTWDGDAKEQWAYVDGVGVKFGSVAGQTFGKHSLPVGVGGNDNGNLAAGFVFSVDDLSIWDGYALTQQDVRDIRDGRKPKDVGVTATRRVVWSMGGPDGGAPTPGQGGLANSLGGGPDLSVATGSGSAAYSPPLDWSPSVRAVDACVTTSGKLVGMRFRTIAGGAASTLSSVHQAPTIRRNGVPIPPSDKPAWITGFHDAVLIPLSERVFPGDTVTIDAPAGWAQASHGLVTGFQSTAIDNRAGRSSFNSQQGEKTLKVGVNFSFTGAGSDVPYNIPKNMAKRFGFWSAGTGTTADGKPTTLTQNYGTESSSGILEFTADNGVDITGHPLAYGLHAIGWDDPDPANPDTYWFESIYGTGYEQNTTVTERLDLKNTGTLSGGKRVGNVRVFDVQPAAGKPLKMQVNVRVKNNSKTALAENLVIHGPKDFDHTDGVPVVLDRTDPNAVSQVFLDRFQGGAGSFRWMDTITYYMGGSPICEPGMSVGFDDFRWGYNRRLYDKTTRFVEARPYTPGSPTHVYSAIEGSRYDVTLADPVDDSQTTFRILWSDANPVIPHLRLYLDNGDGTEEVVRIVSIPANPVDGQIEDVTVIRGEAISAAGGISRSGPRSHAAGRIQAGYRFPGPSLSDLAIGTGVVYTLVTDGTHDLWTGLQPAPSGTWPAVTFTDGTVITPHSGVFRLMVTGPKTIVVMQYVANAAPVTLVGNTALNPANCSMRVYLPQDGPSFPFEYTAHATGKIPGCDLWLNIPFLASDELVLDIARKCRDKFPPGRNVFVELCNEPWNWGFPQWGYLTAMSRARYPSNGGIGAYAALLERSRKVWDLFEAAFNEGGRNRGGEIKRTVNFQPRAPMASVLDYARTMSVPTRIDACATAPYVLIPDGDYASLDHATSLCQFRWDTEQCIDLFSYHLICNLGPQSFPLSFAMQKGQIDAYNATTGNNCKLVGYEGGVEFPITASAITPAGTVSVASGSPAVVGSGTKFLRYFVAGQSIVIKASSGDRIYRVQSVTSDTSLTLAENYAGPTESGRPHQLSSMTFTPVAGTVSVASGSPAVVGTGTKFDQSMVGTIIGIRQPDGVMRYGFPYPGLGPHQYFFVKSVADETHLTLEKKWNGTTAAGCPAYAVLEHADTKARDMVYHPNWYFTEHDFYRLVQDSGFYRWSVFCYGGSYFKGRYLWPIYAWLYQDHGYGDGRDGKANNLLYLAQQGLPNSKSPTVNKDLASVSVRGQALIDWNSGAMRPLTPWTNADLWEVAPFDPMAGYGPTLGYDTPEQAEAARNRMLGNGASNVHVRRVRAEVVPAGK